MVVALICGGGNGAHVTAGVGAAQPGVETRVLTLYADEAERWTGIMNKKGFSVTCKAQGKDPVVHNAKPTIVTKNAADAARGATIIVFVVPAFAHEQYLTELKPHVKPGTILVGLPGQAGFEFAVMGIWGDLARQCTIMSFESLPWACRMTEFGATAEVLGTKASLVGAVQVGTPPPAEEATASLQKVLGPQPQLVTQGHLLGITLMSTNGYIHPSIMYGRWHNWDGKACDEAPLFYNGLDQFSADVLSKTSDEVVATAKALMTQRTNVDLTKVTHMHDWYIRCYGDQIAEKKDLYTCIQTNAAYKGLLHPVEQTPDGKFVPNYGYRYMTEDIPFGLVVMRGIADIAGVQTPMMDKVITWAQGCMGKEYLKDGKLQGKDIMSSRCAQRYNITSVDKMLGLK